MKYACLWKFINFGKRHLEHLVFEFVEYYNKHRSHMERDRVSPLHAGPEEVDMLKMDPSEGKSYVGRLVKSFERKAV